MNEARIGPLYYKSCVQLGLGRKVIAGPTYRCRAMHIGMKLHEVCASMYAVRKV